MNVSWTSTLPPHPAQGAMLSTSFTPALAKAQCKYQRNQACMAKGQECTSQHEVAGDELTLKWSAQHDSAISSQCIQVACAFTTAGLDTSS